MGSNGTLDNNMAVDMNMNSGIDYEYNPAGENMGGNFNMAYSGQSMKIEDSRVDGDVGKSLERMMAERNNMNKQLESMSKKGNMNGENNKNNNFFFLNNKKKKKKKRREEDIDEELEKLEIEISLMEEETNKNNRKNKKNKKNNKDKEVKEDKMELEIKEEDEEEKEDKEDKKKALIKLLMTAKEKDKEKEKNIEIMENKTIEIIAGEITESECYNDYMYNMEEEIEIVDIEIEDIEINKRSDDNIKSNNNKLYIEYDGKEHEIELDENYYNREEIVEYINEGLRENEIEVECEIKDGRFEFRGKKRFSMNNREGSILYYLGFIKSSYINKESYISERTINIGDNIFYIVIDNIEDEPLFRVDMDNGRIEKLLKIKRARTDYLTIKYYRNEKDIIKNDINYNFFFERDNRIKMNITFVRS